MNSNVTSLTTRSSNGVLAAVPGTESLDRSDMVIPRLRLVQSQSAFTDADAGLLHNSLTGEAKTEVRAVILKIGKSRVMWPADFQRDQEPLCASNDAVVPRDQFRSVYAEGCSQCTQAKWHDDAPPACAFSYTYLLADRDADDLPAILSVSRSSLRAAKQVNTLVAAFGVRREVIVSSEQIVNDKGKYYVLTFRMGAAVANDEVMRYAAMSRALGGVVLAADTPANGDENDEAVQTVQAPKAVQQPPTVAKAKPAAKGNGKYADDPMTAFWLRARKLGVSQEHGQKLLATVFGDAGAALSLLESDAAAADAVPAAAKSDAAVVDFAENEIPF